MNGREEQMKKAFDNAKAANQFCRSSSYFFFAAFFFVAFFFIGMVSVPPMERCSLELWRAVSATPLIAWPLLLPQDIVLTF